jgi:hypothetical protein
MKEADLSVRSQDGKLKTNKEILERIKEVFQTDYFGVKASKLLTYLSYDFLQRVCNRY